MVGVEHRAIGADDPGATGRCRRRGPASDPEVGRSPSSVPSSVAVQRCRPAWPSGVGTRCQGTSSTSPGGPAWCGERSCGGVTGGPPTGTVRERNSMTDSGEHVVAVAGDHVPGAGDVDVLARRAQLEELLGALLGEDVGQPAAHQQRGQVEVARAVLEALGALLQVARPGAEARVPVPVVAAVVAEADVLRQAVERSRPGAVRLVAGDRVGHLVERLEALRTLLHERTDLGDADRVDARGDVDEHERGGVHPVLADGDEARAATHRRAHQDGPAVVELRRAGLTRSSTIASCPYTPSGAQVESP